jgi:hypothetical protein
MTSRAESPASLTLQPGQVAWLRVAAGSSLFVLEGRGGLREPPQWLADRVWQTPVVLATGQRHRIARSGWMRLEAAVALRCRLEPPAGLAAYWGRVRTAGSATSRPITERA